MRVLVLATALLVGCATSALRPITAGSKLTLGAKEGLLIIDIDTDVPIERIDAGRGVSADKLAKGRHTWIVRAPAGEYRWKRLEFGPESGKALVDRASSFPDDEFAFEVVPGVLNYPGELILRSNPSFRSSGFGFSLRNRNHSAMAVRALRKTHAEIIDAYMLKYSGPSDDGFLGTPCSIPDSTFRVSFGGRASAALRLGA